MFSMFRNGRFYKYFSSKRAAFKAADFWSARGEGTRVYFCGRLVKSV